MTPVDGKINNDIKVKAYKEVARLVRYNLLRSLMSYFDDGRDIYISMEIKDNIHGILYEANNQKI